MKLNKNIIYYITDDLDEKVGFFLNCKTNKILKLDSAALDYLKIILNANSKQEIEKYICYFKGSGLFEQDI